VTLPVALLKNAVRQTARRIAPGDSNYFLLLFDPDTEGYDPVAVIEIFEEGGATPPNSHVAAHEFFFVLHGRGIARAGGGTLPLTKGDALLLRPGTEHVIENVGPGKLYTLTVMTPDEGFAAMIRAGTPVLLDAEDLAVLAGSAISLESDPHDHASRAG
jgi:mannose-6-phosphate isomerase-like protein (cupin superfamily)